MILKLKMLVSDDNNIYLDWWLRADEIKGFYIPVDEHGNKDTTAINLMLSSETMTVINEPHIEKFLMDHFVSQT